MKTRAIHKWALISALITCCSAFAQTTLTAAVEHAVKNSPDIKVDAMRRLSADETLRGAYSGYLPRADIGMGIGRERADNSNTRVSGPTSLTRREKSLTLSQMLFDSFATANEVARNRARVESSAYRVAGTSEQIALRVVEAYLDVLRLRENVQLTRENLAAHQKTYDQITLRVQSGVGRKADQDQSSARLALSKANLASSEANLRDAEINFQRFTGLAPDQLIKPEGPKPSELPASLTSALEQARDVNPLLKQAKADLEAANAQNRAAKSAIGPRFDLEAGINNLENASGYEGDSNSRYAMLRMRWNLLRGGADTARIGETRALTYEAMEVLKRTELQLDQSVSLSWNANTSVRTRLPNLKQHVESSLLTRDAYVLQFGIGQRTLIDLLDTENEYYTSSVEYLNAQYLELFSRYRLLADTGRLLDALKVSKREESIAPLR
jgi:adhesin transport system outer membrane protein